MQVSINKFHKHSYSVVYCLLLLLFISCKSKSKDSVIDSEVYLSTLEAPFDSVNFTLEDFIHYNPYLDKQVEYIYNKLSDTARIAQMIMPVGGKSGIPLKELESLIQNELIGGVLMLSGDSNYVTETIKHFNKLNESNALPILYSADAEPTLINNKFKGLRKFPPTSSLSTEHQIDSIAKEIAFTLKDMGIYLNFAPVCDVAINKEIVGRRSFGNDPIQVGEKASIFARSTQAEGVAATAKHFPGHGNVKGDTHKSIVYNEGDLAEIPAFKKAIEQEIALVMVGHIAVRNHPDWDSDDRPASCSRTLVTGLLRNQLNFQGLITTDAMIMQGTATIKNPSFEAAKAGCDLILMPKDAEQLHQDIYQLSKVSPAYKKQFEESVKKVIRLKICLNLIPEKMLMKR